MQSIKVKFTIFIIVTLLLLYSLYVLQKETFTFISFNMLYVYLNNIKMYLYIYGCVPYSFAWTTHGPISYRFSNTTCTKTMNKL